MRTPDQQRPFSELLSPEQFWAQYEAEIEAELKTIATKTDKFKQSWFEWAIKSERQFASQVLAEAGRMQQETGVKDALVLFDVDETIASPYTLDNYKTMLTLLRPTASRVFSALKQAGLRIGFLTSRTGGPLKEELEKGSMQPLSRNVSPEHVYTRELEQKYRHELRSFDSREFGEQLFEMFGGPESFLDEEKVRQSVNYQQGWWQGGAMTRLQIIKKLREEIKGPFMVVDDLEYPHILNGKNGVYGVELDQNSKFFNP
jgi:hypothetical protein